MIGPDVSGQYRNDGVAEVVERLLSVRLRADDDVRLEPDERALVVEVRAAPVGSPGVGRAVEQLRGGGGVGKRPPGPARALVEVGGHPREALLVLHADLEMLVNVGGQERTTDEYAKLFERSGLRLVGTVPLGSSKDAMGHYLVEARPV